MSDTVVIKITADGGDGAARIKFSDGREYIVAPGTEMTLTIEQIRVMVVERKKQ